MRNNKYLEYVKIMNNNIIENKEDIMYTCLAVIFSIGFFIWITINPVQAIFFIIMLLGLGLLIALFAFLFSILKGSDYSKMGNLNSKKRRRLSLMDW